MIRMGALGCEYLNNFSLIGISNSHNKVVIITGNTNIELRNLNRLFLFKNWDIRKSKSFCAYIKK